MSKTVLVQARISPEVKADVEKLFEAWGFDISTAFRMFLNKVSRDRAMPFVSLKSSGPPRRNFTTCASWGSRNTRTYSRRIAR